MENIAEFIRRYSFGFFGAMQAYCKWAEGQARNQKDLALLGFGPMILIAVGLLLAPKWIGIPILGFLTLPFLYIAFLLLRAIALNIKK